MKNNEKIQFSNLRYEGDKVFFININTQAEEHLFQESILSIDEGEVEYVEKEVAKKFTESGSLKDGVYQTLGNLKVGKSQSGTYKAVAKNPNRNLYQVVDANGKKINNVFAVVEDGVLYVRGKGIKTHQTNKMGLQFKRNGTFFIKMNYQNGQYVGRSPFINGTAGILGAVLIGGGAGFAGSSTGIQNVGWGKAILIGVGVYTLYYFAISNQKEVVLDLQNEKITLR